MSQSDRKANTIVGYAINHREIIHYQLLKKNPHYWGFFDVYISHTLYITNQRYMTAIQEILKSIKSIKEKERQLSKNDILSILEATKTISKHKNFINSLILFFTTIDSNQNYNTNQLTKRELQILNLIGNGKESKSIAKDLELQISTVETHRKNIRKKLNLVGKGKLLKFAIYNNLQH